MTASPHKGRTATKQETRDALVEAGLLEFAERGLDAPSLDAICARAGFTRGAFYVHFRDREDFLESVMEKVFVTFLDAVIATGDGARDLETTVERFIAAIAAVSGGSGPFGILKIDVHRVLDACARSPLLRRRFVALLAGSADRVAAAVERGQRAGSVRADVDPEMMGQLLALLAFGALTAVNTGVAIDFDKARATVIRLLAAPSKL